jgi:hypothetical protein
MADVKKLSSFAMVPDHFRTQKQQGRALPVEGREYLAVYHKRKTILGAAKYCP